uniref:hypothetical protein n=1 Tax=Xenorhabdus sp. PB61.4 TaxID=2788940 RepID=UPI001E2B24FE
VGEGLINLLENITLDIINITNVANSNIMRTIINSVNNHISSSTFGGRLANHTGKAMISGARKASEDAATLAFKTIGEYMENCIGKYRKYDIILTKEDFESIKELNLVSSNTSPKKAVFLVDKNEFEGNFDVYCPKAEGDALHEIKIIYFKKTAWQFPNDEEVRKAKEAEEAFRQSS